MGSDSWDSTWPDSERLQAARQESRALRQQAQETIARARATCDQVLRGRSRQQVLRDSAFARLHAKQETLAVIEQAKGIIIAQRRCGPDEAFDLLRRASQRTNVKVHVLAAQIVGHFAANDGDDNVTPIAVGAARYLRPGTRPPPPTG